MEQFNKALSFILGLIVVAVFIVFASGKFTIPGLRIPGAQTKVIIFPTPTPTPRPTGVPQTGNWFTRLFARPTVTPTPTITRQKIQFQITQPPQQDMSGQRGGEQTGGGVQIETNTTEYHRYTSTSPTSIPSTGVPLLFIPITLSSLIGGIYLRKKS